MYPNCPASSTWPRSARMAAESSSTSHSRNPLKYHSPTPWSPADATQAQRRREMNTIQKLAEARKMVSDEETTRVVCLAEDVERMIVGRLTGFGLSGQE